jgi:hypothetical protein
MVLPGRRGTGDPCVALGSTCRPQLAVTWIPTKRCYNDPLAALDAGQQAAPLPCRRDEVAAADAVRPGVVRREGIGKGTRG